MSKTLETIEYLASTDAIRRIGDIHRIMCYLLHLKYEDLAPGKGYHDFLIRDMAKGFAVDEQKLRKCSLEQILIIIGFMPGTPWFQIDEEEKWFSESEQGKGFCSAPACYYLASILRNNINCNGVVRAFMRIGYAALISYLDYMTTVKDKFAPIYIPEYITPITENRRIEASSIRFIREVNSKAADKDINDITVGDLIDTILIRMSASWLCGAEPLDLYVSKMKRSYTMAGKFFMDSIRKNRITADRKSFLELMESCSEYGIYDHEDEFDFEHCYE